MSILYLNKLAEHEQGDFECRVIAGNQIEHVKFQVKYEAGIKKLFYIKP